MLRRDFLKLFGAGAAASALSLPAIRAFGGPGANSKDAFIIIHARGGWDVTLWADPRNEAVGRVEPATDAVVEIDGITQWKSKALAGGISTFDLVQRNGFALGPSMGRLTDKFARCTIVNGIAMDTVSHFDGMTYSVTGRHLAGSRATQTSVDAILAGELGPSDLLPLVSVGFPSAFVSSTLDTRAMPLRLSSVSVAARSLQRSNLYTNVEDRRAAAHLVADEARILSGPDSAGPGHALGAQIESLERILANPTLLGIFDEQRLRTALQPRFFMDAAGNKILRRFQDNAALHVAFAVEAIRLGVGRCVSVSTSSFDTHAANYADHPLMLQELFDLIATLIEVLDETKLSDRVHVLVVSDFCRTPQINTQNGRDHYPNNSALIVSPRFKGGLVFGSTDKAELLPTEKLDDVGGKKRPIRPSDVLATFLSSVGVDHRAHLRDGDVIPQVLA